MHMNYMIFHSHNHKHTQTHTHTTGYVPCHTHVRAMYGLGEELNIFLSLQEDREEGVGYIYM